MSNEELVPFGEFSEDDAAVALTASKDKKGYMKIEQGRYVLRLLPPLPGNKPFKTVYLHYLDVPGATRAVVFGCPRIHNQAHCSICEKIKVLDRSGNPADKDKATDMAPRKRVFANVIDRAHPDKGPLIWEFGKSVFDAINGLRMDTIAGGDCTHPLKGFDISVERKGTGRNDTEYTIRAARNSSKLAVDVATMNQWITTQADLDSQAKILSDEEIKKRLSDASQPPAENKGNGRILEASSGKAWDEGEKDEDIPF